MAATDKAYRNQNMLDIVFAVSSLLMLASIMWMFAQDYFREFKTEQRHFRDVEEALAARQALEQAPGEQFITLIRQVLEEKRIRAGNQGKVDELQAKIDAELPNKQTLDSRYNSVKANLDSIVSFRDIAADHYGRDNPDVAKYEKRKAEYEKELDSIKAEKDDVYAKIQAWQTEIDGQEQGLTKKISELKKVTSAFDTQVRVAITKKWGTGDWVRTLPILDAFASPIKIQQQVIKDVTLDYNFVQAVRFDRCQTCHLAIDRPAFTRENLVSLVDRYDQGQEKVVSDLLETIRKMSKTSLPGDYPTDYGRYSSRLQGAIALYKALGDPTLKSTDDIYQKLTAEKVNLGVGPRSQAEQLIVAYPELINALSKTTANTSAGYFPQYPRYKAKYERLKQALVTTTEEDSDILKEFGINKKEVESKLKQVREVDAARNALLQTLSLEQKLAHAQYVLYIRTKIFAGLPEAKGLPEPGALKITKVSKDILTNSRITEFCAHPRLDLHVGPNSKHPVEKFGCTSCHGGQPSGTSFLFASHAPNNVVQKEEWKTKLEYHNVHDWDFPMTPMRFVESGCLKCHHQVTDLISSDNRSEAPKLLKGYNLIKENGCFGCHEIAGRKGGREIGPDLRLEPTPPLDDMTQEQRSKLLANADNMPGQLRKVGPSLYRISEKTTELFTSKWLQAPREFRPDTKMPHFYGLSNNHPKFLPDDQKPYPKAEIQAITHYLFQASKSHLAEVKDAAKAVGQITELDNKVRLFVNTLSFDPTDKARRKTANPAEKKSIDEYDALTAELTTALKQRDKVRPSLVHASKSFKELVGVDAKDFKTDLKLGRQLFVERGCLACHSHQGTEQGSQKEDTFGNKVWDVVPVASEAQFGPNLSQLSEKLVSDESRPLAEKFFGSQKKWQDAVLAKKQLDEELQAAEDRKEMKQSKEERAATQKLIDKLEGDVEKADEAVKAALKARDDAGSTYRAKMTSARAWLVQWLLDPHVYSPRSRMPITHLTPQEAAQVSDWLLEQSPADLGRSWSSDGMKDLAEPADSDTFKNLARVYLVRMLAKTDMNKLLEGKFTREEIKDINPKTHPVLSSLPEDEQNLALTYSADNLKFYLGKKAVSRLGCYACHDVPGFDAGKPIGVALNDWGKKNADRLAFEDVQNYVKHHHFEVNLPLDEHGLPEKFKEEGGVVKTPYEKFYADGLDHHGQNRMSYLFQKLNEPRSYDYNRERAWDDRARMPQFKFARLKPKAKEGVEEFQARQHYEEQLAREAVMTFVLGLTAEQIPTQSLSRPKNDRLAEVKGRQVLDKFNCAGCHQIRPGYLEYNGTPTPGTIEGASGDYLFVDNYNWHAPKSSGSKFIAHGYFPGFLPGEILPDEQNPQAGKIAFRTLHAVRYNNPKGEKNAKDEVVEIDVPAATMYFLDKENFIFPPKEALQTDESWQAFSKQHGAYGGAFSDLLTVYLGRTNPKAFKVSSSDFTVAQARAWTPPTLVNQGAKTQPDWLYRFLIDPHQIRNMIKLRMPKFNMSSEEAKILVEYFEAVERLSNPNQGLDAFDVARTDDYWAAKNREYLQRLKTTKTKDNSKSVYELRLEDQMRPTWKQTVKDLETEKKDYTNRASAAKKKSEELQKEFEKLGADKEKLAEKAKLEGQVGSAKDDLRYWENKIVAVEKTLASVNPDELEKAWLAKDAYITDAFRLVTTSKQCLSCHAIGDQGTQEVSLLVNMGPSIERAHARLRPTWLKQWIANPHRFLQYPSIMIQNFPSNEKTMVPGDQYLEIFPGTPLERVEAVRDILTIYPQAARSPINQSLVRPSSAVEEKKTKVEEEKSEEKKSDEKKNKTEEKK